LKRDPDTVLGLTPFFSPMHSACIIPIDTDIFYDGTSSPRSQRLSLIDSHSDEGFPSPSEKVLYLAGGAPRKLVSSCLRNFAIFFSASPPGGAKRICPQPMFGRSRAATVGLLLCRIQLLDSGQIPPQTFFLPSTSAPAWYTLEESPLFMGCPFEPILPRRKPSPFQDRSRFGNWIRLESLFGIVSFQQWRFSARFPLEGRSHLGLSHGCFRSS